MCLYMKFFFLFFFFFSSRRRHTRCSRDWSSDVCSSDLLRALQDAPAQGKVLAETEHLQQGRAQPRISMASRRPSDSRLNAIDVTKMARPGSAGTTAFT